MSPLVCSASSMRSSYLVKEQSAIYTQFPQKFNLRALFLRDLPASGRGRTAEKQTVMSELETIGLRNVTSENACDSDFRVPERVTSFRGTNVAVAAPEYAHLGITEIPCGHAR